MPRCIYTPQKSTLIWKIYLNYSKCTWKVSILSYNWVSCNKTLGCLRLYGDSRVSRAQPRINAYEILLQHDWLGVFLDIIGSQKHILATYNNRPPPGIFHLLFVRSISYLSYVTLFFIIKLFRLDHMQGLSPFWVRTVWRTPYIKTLYHTVRTQNGLGPRSLDWTLSRYDEPP